MTAKIIAHMRDRIELTRKVLKLAHDPEVIGLLERRINEAQEDIERLEAGELKQ